MCPAIVNPANCEIRAVIHFLHIKNMSAAEIHRQLCAVCGQNVMSEGTLRQLCRMFKDERTNVQQTKRTKWSAIVVSDDPVQIRYYHSYARLTQVLRKMGSENAHESTQNAENGFGSDFL
jgi:hypothetical protein